MQPPPYNYNKPLIRLTNSYYHPFASHNQPSFNIYFVYIQTNNQHLKCDWKLKTEKMSVHVPTFIKPVFWSDDLKKSGKWNVFFLFKMHLNRKSLGIPFRWILIELKDDFCYDSKLMLDQKQKLPLRSATLLSLETVEPYGHTWMT